jgi:hypothetical protein
VNIDPNPYAPPKADATDLDGPSGPSIADRRIAVVDGLVAFSMGAVGLLVLLHHEDVDDVLTLVIFAPNMLLFGLASLGMWRRWQVRWLVQALAILWVILSIALPILAIGEHPMESPELDGASPG